MANRWGNISERLFSWALKSLQMVTATVKLKDNLLLGRRAITNLDIILKSRDINLPTKVCPVKAMVFPVVMYGCESWTIKKAERRRIDAFELWCWERLLRVRWIARRSNRKSVLNILWKNWCWRWSSNTLPTWCEELTCWERLKAGGEGDDRGWDGWMASLTQWTWVWASTGVLQSMGSQGVRHYWATELNWNLDGRHVLFYVHGSFV